MASHQPRHPSFLRLPQWRYRRALLLKSFFINQINFVDFEVSGDGSNFEYFFVFDITKCAAIDLHWDAIHHLGWSFFEDLLGEKAAVLDFRID